MVSKSNTIILLLCFIFVTNFSFSIQSFFFKATVLIAQTLHPLKIILPVIDENLLSLPNTFIGFYQHPRYLVFNKVDLAAVLLAAVVYESCVVSHRPPVYGHVGGGGEKVVGNFQLFVLLPPVLELFVGNQFTRLLAYHAACKYF